MMKAKRIFLALVITAMTATVTSAQMRRSWGSRPAGEPAQARIRDDSAVKVSGDQSEAPAKPDDGGDGALVGSWRATFTPDPHDPIQFPPLPALFTFTSDGTLVETDGGALAPIENTYGSPGHGVWRRIGPRRFEMKMIIVVVNSDGTLFLTGTIRLTVQLSANGNSLQGHGTYSFVDPNGVDYGTGAEDIVGQRIRLN